MTNTIIIYRDVEDFVWSLAIVLVPLRTLGALSMVTPEEAEKIQSFFLRTRATTVDFNRWRACDGNRSFKNAYKLCEQQLGGAWTLCVYV